MLDLQTVNFILLIKCNSYIKYEMCYAMCYDAKATHFLHKEFENSHTFTLFIHFFILKTLVLRCNSYNR